MIILRGFSRFITSGIEKTAFFILLLWGFMLYPLASVKSALLKSVLSKIVSVKLEREKSLNISDELKKSQLFIKQEVNSALFSLRSLNDE